MGFDQKGSSIFRVSQGNSNQWDVMEEGFDKPLASFDVLEDAREYAFDIAKTKGGSEVFDNHGIPILDKGDAAASLRGEKRHEWTLRGQPSVNRFH